MSFESVPYCRDKPTYLLRNSSLSLGRSSSPWELALQGPTEMKLPTEDMIRNPLAKNVNLRFLRTLKCCSTNQTLTVRFVTTTQAKTTKCSLIGNKRLIM